MGGLNRVIIVGRLGTDHDLRKVGEKAVTTLSVATSEKYQDREFTEWHSVVVWGKMAELCATRLAKGDQVAVEGRLQTRSWEDKDGNKRFKTEILSSHIQFINSGEKKASKEDEGWWS